MSWNLAEGSVSGGNWNSRNDNSNRSAFNDMEKLVVSASVRFNLKTEHLPDDWKTKVETMRTDIKQLSTRFPVNPKETVLNMYSEGTYPYKK